jgi:hypothetical protein
MIGSTGVFKGKSRFTFSDDGITFLATTGGREAPAPTLFRISNNGLTQISLTMKGGNGSEATALSPDGRRAAVAHPSGSIEIFDAADGASIAAVSVTDLAAHLVALSTSGELVAATDDSNTVWIVDRSSGAPLASPVMPSRVVDMRFATGDDRLVVLTQSDGAFFIDLNPIDGLPGDATALVDWIRASQPEAALESERQKFRIINPTRFKRDDLKEVMPDPAQPKAASMGDAATLAIQSLGKASGAGDVLREALSAEMALGRTRVSWAALAIGKRIDDSSNADAKQLRLALFFYELGLWLADNVQQGPEAPEAEIALQNAARDRVRQLVGSMPPRDVVAIYRAARDWRAGAPLARLPGQ